MIPQILTSIFALLSFLTAKNPLYLLLDLELSTKWVLYGMMVASVFGPEFLGCTIFCVCGLVVWVALSHQKLWLWSFFSKIRKPFPVFVSVPPSVFWVTSFLPELVRWGWFVELIVILVFFHKHMEKAWRNIEDLNCWCS